MWGLVALVARIVISLILTLVLAYNFQDGINVICFMLMWIMFYAMTSVYYHVRRFMNEEESDRIKGNRMRMGVFDMLFSYIIFPLLAIVLYFVIIPGVVAKILPDSIENIVRSVVTVLLIGGVLIFDVKRARDDYQMKQAMTRKVSDTPLEEKENNGGWAPNILWEQENAEFEESIKKNNNNEQEIITDINSRECSLVEKYIQHCQKDGVPDEIIELMKQQGMTLMHCMQIKFGYEDGLEVKDIRQYAHPTYDKQQCVNIRYQLLKDKNVPFVKGTGRCPNCKKSHAMKEIGRTLVDIRDSTERVNKSYYDPQTRMKEYYTEIVDATLLKYDVVEECQYCGYRRHNVYSEKATKM